MKWWLAILVLMVVLILRGSTASAQPVDVTKTNPLKVYMHYMPWFDTPATRDNGQWGLHWTMSTRNPNIVDSTGKRQIASHFYPKIGPYASSDPDVIEYHFLLMKYSGVDGILMDWYGAKGANGDINDLLENSNAIRDQTDNFGMRFAVVFEDRFARFGSGDNAPADISKAVDNVAYLRDHYFNRPEYIRIGTNPNPQLNDPLLMLFGPETFNTSSQWTQILAAAGGGVNFLPLQNRTSSVGSTNADGEYGWVHQDANTSNHLSKTRNFYTSRAPSLNIAGGAAYPGFLDYYQEGGWGSTLFEIPHADGATLDQTLGLANTYGSQIDFLQLITWNDYGEGTMFEPTVETGFEYLKRIQAFTGVSYGEDELQLVYRLYLARKKYAGDGPIEAMLDQVSTLLTQLEVGAATDLLNSAAPAGDFNADGHVDNLDYAVWRNSFGSSTILYGSGADGNYDGKVDAADFTIWRNSVGNLGGGAVAVPEPSALMLTMLAAAGACHARSIARPRGDIQ